MKTNQKGFTLIELLAVIIILAIIALIAVPTIMNIIDKARISAAEDSAYGVISAAELWYSESLLKGNGTAQEADVKFNGTTISVNEPGTETELESAPEFKIKGTAPTAGTVNITDEGVITFKQNLVINGKTCTLSNSIVECTD